MTEVGREGEGEDAPRSPLKMTSGGAPNVAQKERLFIFFVRFVTFASHLNSKEFFTRSAPLWTHRGHKCLPLSPCGTCVACLGFYRAYVAINKPIAWSIFFEFRQLSVRSLFFCIANRITHGRHLSPPGLAGLVSSPQHRYSDVFPSYSFRGNRINHNLHSRCGLSGRRSPPRPTNRRLPQRLPQRLTKRCLLYTSPSPRD